MIYIVYHIQSGTENIIEDKVCIDNVHMLVEILPKVSASSFMRYLKGKSSLIILKKYGNIKYENKNREFCYKEYYVDSEEKNTKK